MTPDEAKKLEPGDRIKGIRSTDPLVRRSYKGLVVRRTQNGVIIRTDDIDDPPGGNLYSFSDPWLARARLLGPGKPGDPPWLAQDATPRRRKGRGGGGRGSGRR